MGGKHRRDPAKRAQKQPPPRLFPQGGGSRRQLVLLLAATLLPAAAPDPLLAAYPHQFVRIGPDLVWPDGTRIAVPAAQTSYPRILPPAPPAEDEDPGRDRNAAFLARMYGDCRLGEVAAHLVATPWIGGHSVQVTEINHVDRHLAAVARELDAPDLRRYLWPIAGTYVCRAVADTGAPSMHSYGAAIDINLSVSDYWLWRHGAPWRDRVPDAIVAAFERHGFIWGGRWAHYDTMHFEYRPDLLGMSAEDPD